MVVEFDQLKNIARCLNARKIDIWHCVSDCQQEILFAFSRSVGTTLS